ncbi:MAG: MFS transporter, partial [Mycobacteriales bacterium]
RSGVSLRRIVSDLDPRRIDGPLGPIGVLCVVALFAQLDNSALGVLLPQIRTSFGVSIAFLATIGSVAGAVGLLVQLPLGYLADRVRRVWMVRIGTVATSLTTLAQGLSGSIGQLATVRAGNSISQSVAPPASFPLLTDYYPSRSRARVFALYFAASQVGLIAGPLLSGLLGQRFGWRTALISIGAAATVAGLLTLLLREPVRGGQDRLESGAGPAAVASAPPPPSWGEAYRAAASVATLRRMWYATPFISIQGYFGLVLLPLFYAQVYQLDTAQLGLVFALSAISGLVGLLVAGPVGDRVLRVRPGRFMTLMGWIVVAQAASLVLIALTSSLLLTLVATQLVILVETALTPAFYTLISMVVPARARGLGLQTSAPWQLIGLIVYPVIVGYAANMGLHRGVLLFVPLLLVGAVILGTGSGSVDRDIRAAKSASMADEEARRARDSGRAKLLVCRQVEAVRGGTPVLFGVDFDVADGEITALLGSNGAGKSTLLAVIGGLLEATGGAVFFDGRDITHTPAHEIAAAGVVTMPGGDAVFPRLTVRENLRTAGWLRRSSGRDGTEAGDGAEAGDGLAEVFSLFPVLRDRLDQPAGTLSGGEQQMLGLAQAFLMRPRLLLVDELSLGLAPAVVEQLLEVLRTLRDRGATIVLVEQSLNIALTVADRAVYLDKGVVRFAGPTEALLSRPDLVRSVFMGGAVTGSGPRRRRTEAAPPGQGALVLTDVSVSFGGVVALDGVDLEVSAGELVGLIGPNGAGKTTLLDVASGFVTPDRGEVRLAGADITRLSPDARARRGLGRSFQSARLFPALTVAETLATFLERRAVGNPVLAAVWAPQVRRAEARIARRVDVLLEMFGLGRHAGKFVGELSTGTRRALDMAAMMALEPTVLLLDEPSTGLAQAETEQLGPLLRQVVRDSGCAMIVIEHDLPLVTSVADRLVAMAGGKVITTGPPAQVCADPTVLTSYLAASAEVLARSGSRMSALGAALHAATADASPPTDGDRA